MQKANLLADNIQEFIRYVPRLERLRNTLDINRDKLYQIKLYIEEFKFQILADELHRINRFEWDEKYTYYLVGQFVKGIDIIDEYVHYNESELFFITARLHTLKNLCSLFQNQDVVND